MFHPKSMKHRVTFIALQLILFAVAIIKRLKVTRFQNTAFICTIIALICSIIPILMFGTDYMSMVGIAITLLLLVSVIFQALANRGENS